MSARDTVENPGKNVRQKAGLDRAILDATPGELKRQLEYKTEKYGSRLMELDTWYPSSKTCSRCGWVHPTYGWSQVLELGRVQAQGALHARTGGPWVSRSATEIPFPADMPSPLAMTLPVIPRPDIAGQQSSRLRCGSSGVPTKAGPQPGGSRSTTIAVSSCGVAAGPTDSVRRGPSTR
ncbi:zinc ribbon domain-containing protein [Streptomyces hesseae]|uniref:Zinc ribbon domain-containing protein n=1 Tax=Streptomyces hesseae TaxID=3075519 RepID=A0ABU2SKF2_9ACTN|nr:zinc ribbon domain-containing protein [Streptomyces sp. DSM 40473]MDT0449451.1 zinc ribbon domain-containing protein [Streptomyces sp. DSM 40473]